MNRTILHPRFLFLLIAALTLAGRVRAEDSGKSVVVVYNTQMPESKEVADHYAARRQVPPSQVFG